MPVTVTSNFTGATKLNMRLMSRHWASRPLGRGFFLICERILGKKMTFRFPQWFQHTYAVLVIVLSWVIFRADSFEQICAMYSSMAGLHGHWISNDTLQLISTPHFYVYFLFAVLFCTPIVYKLDRQSHLWSLGIFLLSCIFLCGQEYNPFIYFRF